MNQDRLFGCLDQLLPHKHMLERHLKDRLGELFDLDCDLLFTTSPARTSKERPSETSWRSEVIRAITAPTAGS